ncbi:zf-TFIIB domain-containing protein [Paenibacillus terrigena]|uniref:TFIIB-type zinc ribbon-containing protein n=1 Tax=Paenibacillus terrigena TaxID=369333 RepID=UPI0028D3CCFF|nr:zf-TFIIB domain-containing protein [Paenibacillus terrigena]
MNCPVCHDTRMREVEKDGILIDICPTCKGVWLDRGELEKLMSGVREIRPAFNQWYDDEHDKHARRDSYDDDRHRYDSHNNQLNHNQPHYNNKHKKKKSVLDVFGDLFD